MVRKEVGKAKARAKATREDEARAREASLPSNSCGPSRIQDGDRQIRKIGTTTGGVMAASIP